MGKTFVVTAMVAGAKVKYPVFGPDVETAWHAAVKELEGVGYVVSLSPETPPREGECAMNYVVYHVASTMEKKVFKSAGVAMTVAEKMNVEAGKAEYAAASETYYEDHVKSEAEKAMSVVADAMTNWNSVCSYHHY